MSTNGDPTDEAIGWHLRLRHADAGAWRRFAEWLEVDPANAAAYDRIELDDLLLAPHAVPLAGTIPADLAPHRRWGRWAAGAGGAIAAALAAALLVPEASVPADRYAIETPAGQSRQVALADGTRIAIGGGTRLVLDRHDRRFAMLDRGEALFTVAHDRRHPFELHTGGVTLRDLGTVFDVSRDGGRTAVAVAEGAVLFQPDREAVTLRRGAALSLRDGTDRILLRHVAAETVGSWRAGVLSFREEALADVVRAVARHSGARLALDPALAATYFTGVVRLSGDARRDVAHLAALAGVRVEGADGSWKLVAAPDEGG